MSIAEDLGYRSPISKLLPFFCGSRDKWKAKCKAAKVENKSLKIRLAKMTASRDRWRAIAGSVESGTEPITVPAGGKTKNRL